MTPITQIEKKFSIYYVGGYVRDLLRGVESKDIDLAIDAPLSEWVDFLKDYKPYIMTRYESCSFRLDGKHYTISRMRKDIACDGRQANIIPVHTITEDALRRDFTMNAIYMTMDGDFLDPVGGMDDLKNKIVKFIGDPKTRIQEDQLRILRYFRFCVLLGVMPEKKIIKISEEYLPILSVSKERIKEEYRKLLKLEPIDDFLSLVQPFYEIE